MYVIGTAGHVDHGKSTLIEALTGIDPDRLAEEKVREMTIDLGFAWLNLGDEDEEVGVIDVPGHRDFIENMLAGIGGIDLAVLVIAADEGIMPQTMEHLAILDLLEVPAGIVALTKVDLVDDDEWLELVKLDIEEVLTGTALAQVPIVPVSAKSGVGLPALKQTIWQLLEQTPPRADEGMPRLPIDRVFSLSGFGTVVTGTLLGGKLQIGDGIVLLPGGIQGRVRGLQTHRQKRRYALPGSRVAVNLSGVDRDEAQRGQVLALPNGLRETVLFDASYRQLEDAGIPLKHNMAVKLFVGSAERVARTRVLGVEKIEAGETGFLQLALKSPLAVTRGDRFILRRPSPGQTVGGGVVLDPHPGRQHRRFQAGILERLQTLADGTPDEVLLQSLRRIEPTNYETLLKQSGLAEQVAESAWQKLVDAGKVVVVGKQLVSLDLWTRSLERVLMVLSTYHTDFPLRLGMPKGELRSKLKMPATLFNPLMAYAVQEKLVQDAGAIVGLTTHEIIFTAEQTERVTGLIARFENAGINSPTVKACKEAVGDELYFALVETEKLVPVSNEVVYQQDGYQQFLAQIVAFIEREGSVPASKVRDLLGTSRKYAIAWLEHLDQLKITRRVGDERELIRKA